MTEAEWWPGCCDPRRMLGFLWGRASDGKLRLFVVACCRRIWPLLTDERSRKAVEAAELFADGQVTREDLGTACGVASQAASEGWSAAAAAWNVCRPRIKRFTTRIISTTTLVAGRDAGRRAEPEAQCDLLRDIFSNVFRLITIDPAWTTPAVEKMA
jgi:hypothetical protein